MAKVLIPLAEGFEEIEAISIIDVLKRGGIEVTVAGLTDIKVTGAYAKIPMITDTLLSDVDINEYDMFVLPGGLPGAEYLRDSELVQNILKEFDKRGKVVGAICAAPWALDRAGVLKSKYTCYPSCEEAMSSKEGYRDSEKVVIDANVMTSRGPATAICFGLEIVRKFQGEESYQALKSGLLADYC